MFLSNHKTKVKIDGKTSFSIKLCLCAESALISELRALFKGPLLCFNFFSLFFAFTHSFPIFGSFFCEWRNYYGSNRDFECIRRSWKSGFVPLRNGSLLFRMHLGVGGECGGGPTAEAKSEGMAHVPLFNSISRAPTFTFAWIKLNARFHNTERN